MKIVNIIGGLGNQMFQYAFAKELEKRSAEKIYIDTSWFYHYKLHNGFELSRIFTCTLPHAHIKDVENLSTIPCSFFSRIRRKYLTKPTHYIDKYLTYDESVFKKQGDIYYEGYWQSESYFADVIEKILSDFTFTLPLNLQSSNFLSHMPNTSVSIHVRRGDYLKESHLNICTKQYYHNALEKLHKISQTPIELYAVFSDDISWCKEHLDIDTNKTIFVDWNTKDDSWQDMALMSHCTHNIIANSSFSWWGAYLNQHKHKIIIAPCVWDKRELQHTKDNYYRYDFSTVIPPTWIRVNM